MSERLTLQDLIDLLAQKQDLTKKDAELFLRELLAIISETIETNEIVKIKDFGTFKLVKVNARKSVDVNTGEAIEIAAHYKLSFTPEKSLKEAINRPFAHFESVVIEDGVNFEDTKESDETDEDENSEDTTTDNDTATETKNVVVESNVLPIITPYKENIYSDTEEIKVEEEIRQPITDDSFNEEKQPDTDTTIAQEEIENTTTIGDDDKEDEYSHQNEPVNDFALEDETNNEVQEEYIAPIIPTIVEPEMVESSETIKDVIVEEEQPNLDEKENEVIDYNPIVEPNTKEMEEKNWNSNEEEYNNNEADMQDDDMYDEGNSNKKTYIIIAIVLLLVLGIILGSRCCKQDNTPPEIAPIEEIKDTVEVVEEIIEEVKDTEEFGVEIIIPHQTLRQVSLKHYGKKSYWVYIYEENKDKIDNPDKIYPGTELIVPPLSKYGVEDPNDPKQIQKALRKSRDLVLKFSEAGK